jgi:hypothetical protein
MPLHGLAKVANAETSPRKREAAARAAHPLAQKAWIVHDPLKTAPHQAAGEISGLGTSALTMSLDSVSRRTDASDCGLVW